jgi:hypothetical protein
MNPYGGPHSPAFDDFLIWLSTTPLRLFFYRFEDFDWLIVFAHVASAAVLFGAILIVDLRLMGVMRKLEPGSLAKLALPWAVGGALTALASGFILLMFDPIAVGVHTYFLPKMLLIVLGLGNAVLFHRVVRLEAVDTRSLSARFAGALSIALWTGVFLCATLNGTERIGSAAHASLD